MECYDKAMKIKFSKEVRAALKRFSNVDRREYIEKAVEKQLAKDAQDPVVISRGTVQFCRGGSLIVDEWSASDSGSVCSSGGNQSNELLPYQKEMQQAIDRGAKVSIRHRDQIPPSEVLYRSTASDPEQKESEPVSETPRVTTWGPVEGTVQYSHSCISGSGSGFVGVGFAGGGGSRFTSGSPVSDSGYVFGSGTGGNASQSN